MRAGLFSQVSIPDEQPRRLGQLRPPSVLLPLSPSNPHEIPCYIPIRPLGRSAATADTAPQRQQHDDSSATAIYNRFRISSRPVWKEIRSHATLVGEASKSKIEDITATWWKLQQAQGVQTCSRKSPSQASSMDKTAASARKADGEMEATRA
jgi:hypothetical protein